MPPLRKPVAFFPPFGAALLFGTVILDSKVNDEVQEKVDDQQPESAGNQSAVRSLGQRLRAERERQEITLDDVMLDTRIPRQHIENIENDQLDSMPSEGYLKGYIRNYSRYLKLDPEEMLGLLGDSGTHEEELVHSDTGKNRAAARFFRDFQGVGTIIGIAIFSLAILCGAFAIWWFGFHSPRDESSSSNSSEQSQHNELESASQSSASFQSNGSAQPASTYTSSSPDNSLSLPASTVLDQSVSDQSDEDESLMNLDSSTLSSTGETAGDPSDSDDSSEFPLELGSPTIGGDTQPGGNQSGSVGDNGNGLVFEGSEGDVEEESEPEHDLVFTFVDDDSYLAVTDATDSQLVRGVQEQGTEIKLDGEAPFRINIGNVNAVRMLFQGEEVALDQYTDRASTTASFELPP